LPLDFFSGRNFVAYFFLTEFEFCWEKTAKSRFVPPFVGLRGNVHGSAMARWKAHGPLHFSAN